MRIAPRRANDGYWQAGWQYFIHLRRATCPRSITAVVHGVIRSITTAGPKGRFFGCTLVCGARAVMKRPQGNILRPPGSKYLNAKKVPARFGKLNSPRHRSANRIGVFHYGTLAPVALLTPLAPSHSHVSGLTQTATPNQIRGGWFALKTLGASAYWHGCRRPSYPMNVPDCGS
jgi:hypothetical protein